MEVTDSFKQDLRSVLICEKYGINVLQLNREYKQLIGQNIRYDYIKYPSLESFLRTLPDVCTLHNYNGQIIVRAVADEKSQDLQRLIRSTPNSGGGGVNRRQFHPTTNRYSSSNSLNYNGRYSDGIYSNGSHDYSKNTISRGDENGNGERRRRRPLNNEANEKGDENGNGEQRKRPLIVEANEKEDDKEEIKIPIKKTTDNMNEDFDKKTDDGKSFNESTTATKIEKINTNDNRKTNNQLLNVVTGIRGKIFDVRAQQNDQIKVVTTNPQQSNFQSDSIQTNKLCKEIETKKMPENSSADQLFDKQPSTKLSSDKSFDQLSEKNSLEASSNEIQSKKEEEFKTNTESSSEKSSDELLSKKKEEEFKANTESSSPNQQSSKESLQNGQKSTENAVVDSPAAFSDKENEILNKILKLFTSTDYVYDHLIERQFAAKYSESLPDDWFKLVEQSKKFDTIKHQSLRLGQKTIRLIAISQNLDEISRDEDFSRLADQISTIKLN